MNIRQYKQVRAGISLFIGAIVAVSVTQDSYFLAFAGVLTGMLFMVLVRRKVKIVIDEREKTIREKAAQMTYAIFAPTIGIGALVLSLPYQKLSPVFAKGEFAYLESLGTVLAYLTLFLIAIYAISYSWLNKRYGGSSEE